MRKIVSAEQMREIDRLTVERFALPSLLLMEQAANAVVAEIEERFPARSGRFNTAFILCGEGNNGGDGAAIARILWTRGWHARAVLIGSIAHARGDALINFQTLERLSQRNSDSPNYAQNNHAKHSERTSATLTFDECREEAQLHSHFAQVHNNCDVVIDAIFGTGLTRPLSGIHRTAVHSINRIRNSFESDANLRRAPFIVAVDVPSGVYADDPNTHGDAVRAHLTVTFTAPKLANVLPPAARFNGELVVRHIGSPQILIDEADSNTFLTEKSDAQDWLRRTRYLPGSYKNTHGHALVIAGSRQFSGAAVLASHAAMRAGAGLVTLAAPASALPLIAARLPPEVMTLGVDETNEGAISDAAFAQIENLMSRVQIVAVGCGLTSHGESTVRFVRRIVEACDKPLIIDADGLNALAPMDDAVKGTPARPLILTPHEGEMRRLLGLKNGEAITDRLATTRAFASKHNLILVLKGERTLIVAPDGLVMINPTGNAGLGTAGAGDTLTGIITGFNAQAFGMLSERKKAQTIATQTSPNNAASPPREADSQPEQTDAGNDLISCALAATIAAVYTSGLAGDFAAGERGMRTMLASDVRENLSRAVCALDEAGEMP